MAYKCDKRNERHFKVNDKYYGLILQVYIRKEGDIKAPIFIAKPNMIAMLLNISDRSLAEAKRIFENKLEPNIIYINSHFEYNIENKETIFFDFLEQYFVSIVFAYSAVEAFLNSIIPNKHTEERDIDGKLEIFDKERIERSDSLEYKVKTLIPEIYKIELDLSTALWQDFKKLLEIRHELIHPKAEKIHQDVDEKGNLCFHSTQLEFLTKLIFIGIKKDVVESARKLIKYIIELIGCKPILPLEFCDEPPTFDELRTFLER